MQMWKGICYKITPKIQTKRDSISRIILQFNKSMPDEDIPKVKAIFTTENNAYGIIDTNWVEGDEYMMDIEPRQRFSYLTKFKPFRYERLKNMRCAGNESYYTCVASR